MYLVIGKLKIKVVNVCLFGYLIVYVFDWTNFLILWHMQIDTHIDIYEYILIYYIYMYIYIHIYICILYIFYLYCIYWDTHTNIYRDR